MVVPLQEQGFFPSLSRQHIDAWFEVEESGEHAHACFEVYKLYLHTFEKRIEREIAKTCGRNGLRRFYETARAELDRLQAGAHCPNRFFLEALLATTRYDIFFDLMKNEAARELTSLSFLSIVGPCRYTRLLQRAPLAQVTCD